MAKPPGTPAGDPVLEPGLDSAGADDPVVVDREGHVLVLTLNRPDRLNAVDRAVTVAVGDALAEADADRDVRAIVITGAGRRAFSAGTDLKALSRGESVAPDDPRRAAWGFAGLVTHHVSKPLIAAVNGLAFGLGMEIALACDLVVASNTAVFGLPEVQHGVLAGGGGAVRLPAQVPPKIAMEMLLTGAPITAARALGLGLVNEVVPQADVLWSALRLARRIAANAPLAVQATKRVAIGIRDDQVLTEATAWNNAAAELSVLMRTTDAREGLAAFAERRTPVWRGE